VLVLTSLGSLGVGATGLWALATQRDGAGYVTTGDRTFSTGGSALVTVPAELDSPGVGWFYSSLVLGNVRIRVTPVNARGPVFVGIAPSGRVDRYLAGVSRTSISDFWSERTRAIAGGAPASPPGSQDFWAASASGSGPQTVTWDAANGSWSVVVMNPDGRPGLNVRADLGATFPALTAIVVGALVLGGLCLLTGVVLIGGAVRRVRAAGVKVR
jgi:hypothetical protein